MIDRAEVTRLGEGIDQTGEIGDEPMERTADGDPGMVEEARQIGARAIAIVGTAGLRAATNREAVVAEIPERTGLRIEVISGEEEARLAFLATKIASVSATAPVVVFDTGGGSTQLTFAHGAAVDDRFSLPIGAVRFTEQFGLDGAVPAEVVRDARAAIAAEFGRLDGAPRPDALVAMGGAVTNLAAVMQSLAAYDNDAVDGSVLDRAEIERQVELYRSRDADARRAIVGLQPARAEVILAGACVVLDGHGEARPRLADGQRQRAAPRPARRAVRVMDTVVHTGAATGRRAPMTTDTLEQSARIPDAEFVRLMELIRDADSVELKLTVPASDHRRTIAHLPIDPVEAQPTPGLLLRHADLALDDAGGVVRARRIQGGRGDTVVKLRPVVPADLPSELRHEAAFNVEVDAMPGGFVCSGSYKGRSTGQEIRDAVAGTLPIRKIFAKEQRGSSGITPRGDRPGRAGPARPDVRPQGDVPADRAPAALRRRGLVLPRRLADLELSTKCLPGEAFQVAAESRVPAGRGVMTGGVQQTKTRAALNYFKAQIEAAPETGTTRRIRRNGRCNHGGGTHRMCCLFSVLALLGPRAALIVYWLLYPRRLDARLRQQLVRADPRLPDRAVDDDGLRVPSSRAASTPSTGCWSGWRS